MSLITPHCVGFYALLFYRSSIKNFEPPSQFQSHLWTQRYYVPTSFVKIGVQIEKKQLLELSPKESLLLYITRSALTLLFHIKIHRKIGVVGEIFVLAFIVCVH